jgi:hypothetical protein
VLYRAVAVVTQGSGGCYTGQWRVLHRAVTGVTQGSDRCYTGHWRLLHRAVAGVIMIMIMIILAITHRQYV